MVASVIARKLRLSDGDGDKEPGWFKRQVTTGLQSVSHRACLHPIYTIVVVALLASTTYVGLLEGSLFDAVRAPRNTTNQVDVDSLFRGSRNLRLGAHTSWKWQVVDDASVIEDQEVCVILDDDFLSTLRFLALTKIYRSSSTSP